MHRIGTGFAATALALVILFTSSERASAQRADVVRFRSVSLAAGASQYDMSGTGTTPVLAGHAAVALNHWLVAEASVAGIRPKEQFLPRTTYIMPEAQLQLQAPMPVIRPYVGLGGGIATRLVRGGPTQSYATGSVVGGARWLSRELPLVVQAELRVRGIDASGSPVMADWTLGVGRTF